MQQPLPEDADEGCHRNHELRTVTAPELLEDRNLEKTRGVMIRAIISLILLIRHASRPHVALLGRIPGTLRFSDHERNPDND